MDRVAEPSEHVAALLVSRISSQGSIDSLAEKGDSSLAQAIVEWMSAQPVDARADLEAVGRWIESHAADEAFLLELSLQILALPPSEQGVALLSQSPALLRWIAEEPGSPWCERLVPWVALLPEAVRDGVFAQLFLSVSPALFVSTNLERARSVIAARPELSASLRQALQRASPPGASLYSHLLFKTPAPSTFLARRWFTRGSSAHLIALLSSPAPERAVAAHAQALDAVVRPLFVEAVEAIAADPTRPAALVEAALRAMDALRGEEGPARASSRLVQEVFALLDGELPVSARASAEALEALASSSDEDRIGDLVALARAVGSWVEEWVDHEREELEAVGRWIELHGAHRTLLGCLRARVESGPPSDGWHQVWPQTPSLLAALLTAGRGRLTVRYGFFLRFVAELPPEVRDAIARDELEALLPSGPARSIGDLEVPLRHLRELCDIVPGIADEAESRLAALAPRNAAAASMSQVLFGTRVRMSDAQRLALRARFRDQALSCMQVQWNPYEGRHWSGGAAVDAARALEPQYLGIYVEALQDIAAESDDEELLFNVQQAITTLRGAW